MLLEILIFVFGSQFKDFFFSLKKKGREKRLWSFGEM